MGVNHALTVPIVRRIVLMMPQFVDVALEGGTSLRKRLRGYNLRTGSARKL